MSIAYRFEIQHLIPVVVEDDSDNPISVSEARRHVVDNLREYVDSAELGDACISDGVKL